MHIKIRKGLNIPIKGSLDQSAPAGDVEEVEEVTTSEVAVLGSDMNGLRPSMKVAQGDTVKIGDVLFEDKKNVGVVVTAPASGSIKAINRGHRRVLQSVVIATSGRQSKKLTALGEDADGAKIEKAMLKTGLWPAFKTRPYSKAPTVGSRPQAIFVNAMDSNPLAASPMVAIAAHREDFTAGVRALTRLTEGSVYVSKSPDADISVEGERVTVAEFSGPHPAGLSGTHIHFLHPVGVGRQVWGIDAQDVIALGKLVLSGEIWLKRYVAIGGAIDKPRIVLAPLGAKVSEAMGGLDDVAKGSVVISGSPLSGHKAEGVYDYLGRFDRQVAVLAQPKERQFMGWIRQGSDKFSASNVFFTALNRSKPVEMTVSANGSPRAMMPTGVFEDLMPLDILPTQLLRAIVVGDTDTAQQLGCLELEEEDLALLSFACSGKYDYGVALRYCLDKIEKEG